MSRFLLGQNTPDSHQSSPHWLAVVFRYDAANSFSPEKNRDGDTEVSQDIPTGSARPFIISNEIVEWQVSQNKAQYSSSLSMTLVPTTANDQPTDYLNEFNPGDWVVFWAMDDRNTYDSVLSNIQNDKPANAFDSGMKFVGCINSVQRIKSVNEGIVSISYQVQCFSFREFDAKQFYSPYLSALFKETLFQSGLLNLFTSEIDKKIANPIAPVQVILTDLLAILMGAVPAVLQNLTLSQPEDARLYYSKGFSLPRGMLSIFKSIKGQQEPELSYVADLLQSWVGIQSYAETPVSGSGRSNSTSYNFLIPQLTPLLGVNLFTPANFNGNSAWGILSSYVNQPINEHYTALKPGEDGALFPTYIARQLPFTSNAFAQFGKKTEKAVGDFLNKKSGRGPQALAYDNARLIGKTTPYASLPRWAVAEETVLSETLGKTEALRINWVHIPSEYPLVTGANAQLEAARAFGRAPPRTNSIDIRRHGIMAYQNRLRFDILDTQLNQVENGVYQNYWSRFMTDILMGQHLRLGGQITTFGTPEPVQAGDNIEYRGTVYHIESVSHSGGIDGNGNKMFTTAYSLSNGVSADKSFTDDDDFNTPAEASSEAGIVTTERFE